MVRLSICVALTAALCGAAHAIDYRWTTGFAQGTVEAIIRNAAGSSVNIYCPSGQATTTPGMFVEVGRVKPKKDEAVDIQVIVGREKHPFVLQEIQFEAAGRGFYNSLYRLIDALSQAKGRTFAVEFPKYRIAETFSLRDAKRSLGSARDFLSGCEI